MMAKKQITGGATTLPTNLDSPSHAEASREIELLLKQREAELAVISSVQQGLASRLKMQAIYELVGEKLRDVFDAQIVDIVTYDPVANLLTNPYSFEKGDRSLFPPQPPFGFRKYVIETRETLLISDDLEGAAAKYGNPLAVIGEIPRSEVFVPMMVGNQATGVISLQHLDRENAFSESDVRLLETLAASMSVALENARLFEAERQRAAELAVISSVQQGLASKLEMQEIYEMVGEKLREVFDAQIVDILTYEPATNLLTNPYSFEKGDRSLLPPQAPFGFRKHVIETRQTLVLNEDTETIAANYGNPVIVGNLPKSAVFVPMMVGDQATGVISIQNLDREKAFSDADVRLLETLAASMSVALESARLFEAERQRAAELAVISSVQQRLAANLDTQAIYELIGEKIHEIFDAEVVYVALLNPQNPNEIVFPYYFDRIQHEDAPPLELGQGLTSKVLLSRQPLYLGQRHALIEQGVSWVGPQDGSQSYLGIPIIVGDDVIGVLSVQSYRPDAYTERDIHVISTLAASMGVALESARLFEAERQRATELATVNSISQAIVSELDLNALLQLIGEQMRDTFEADIAYVALHNRANNTIEFPYVYGEPEETLPFGVGLTSRILESGQPLLINRDIERQLMNLNTPVVGVDSQSYLGVPIMVGKQAIGALSVQSIQEEGRFDEADVRLLSTIAANVGAAIQNARLFREAEEARAAAVEANKAKSTFLANMSHELRTPLNAIIGFTRIVQRKGANSLEQKQLDNLGKVLSSAEHLMHLINTVLDIAKIEAGRVDIQTSHFEIGPLLDVCTYIAGPMVKPGVALSKELSPDIPSITSDQEKIKQILLNLLSNAAKFTDRGHILLSAYAEQGMLKLSVEDTGIGITPEALEYVFEEFQQADSSTTRQYGGTGLGLAISRSLARLLGGDLAAASQVGVGSTFVLTVPIQHISRQPTPEPPDLSSERL
jgi:signal transduction histidine kinase